MQRLPRTRMACFLNLYNPILFIDAIPQQWINLSFNSKNSFDSYIYWASTQWMTTAEFITSRKWIPSHASTTRTLFHHHKAANKLGQMVKLFLNAKDFTLCSWGIQRPLWPELVLCLQKLICSFQLPLIAPLPFQLWPSTTNSLLWPLMNLYALFSNATQLLTIVRSSTKLLMLWYVPSISPCLHLCHLFSCDLQLPILHCEHWWNHMPFSPNATQTVDHCLWSYTKHLILCYVPSNSTWLHICHLFSYDLQLPPLYTVTTVDHYAIFSNATKLLTTTALLCSFPFQLHSIACSTTSPQWPLMDPAMYLNWLPPSSSSHLFSYTIADHYLSVPLYKLLVTVPEAIPNNSSSAVTTNAHLSCTMQTTSPSFWLWIPSTVPEAILHNSCSAVTVVDMIPTSLGCNKWLPSAISTTKSPHLLNTVQHYILTHMLMTFAAIIFISKLYIYDYIGTTCWTMHLQPNY